MMEVAGTGRETSEIPDGNSKSRQLVASNV